MNDKSTMMVHLSGLTIDDRQHTFTECFCHRLVNDMVVL